MVLVKSYPEPKVNINEILRYIGADESLIPLVKECLSLCENQLAYKVCYMVSPISIAGEFIAFSFGTFKSLDLAKALKDCRQAVIFGATVGVGIDRLIGKYGRLSPSKGVILQGIGAERIEALIGAFLKDFENGNNAVLTPRFSPGYGDLSLEIQRDLFKILDCPVKIGLSLTDSLLMSPSKSVTAIAGIKHTGEQL